MGVKATRDQDPIRREAIDRRLSDLLERALHDVSGRTPWQWDIDRQPNSIGTSHFIGTSGTREKGPLVRRDVKNPGVIPKNGLGSIAVMDVPVDDQYPVAFGCKRCRTHGNVVQQAEPHCAVCFSVMSRWSHGDEGDAFTLQLQGSDRLEAGAGGATGRCEGIRSGIRVGIDVSASLHAKTLQFAEVFDRVHPRQRFEVRFGSSDEVDAVFDVEIAYPIHHRKDPGLLLRVKCAPVVCIRARWANDDQHPSHTLGSSATGRRLT